jgi:hypothetical protein
MTSSCTCRLRAPHSKRYKYGAREPTISPHQQPPSTKHFTTSSTPLYTIMSGNSNSFSQTNARDSFDPADTFRGQPRPEHHIHRESELLPGSEPISHDQDQMKDSGMRENRRDIGTSFVRRPCLFAYHHRSFVRCHWRPRRVARLRHFL